MPKIPDIEQFQRYAQLAQQRMQAANQEEAEQETKPPQKSMSRGAFVFFLVFAVIGDIIDFFTGGTIGWAIGLVIDGLLLLGIGFSQASKKQLERMLVGIGLETVLPIVGMLPFRTVFLIWAYMDSRGKTGGIKKVTSIVSDLTKAA